jgi:RNA polymerase sigma factor (sigma-70 family)
VIFNEEILSSNLSPREQNVIKLRFGWNSGKGMSLEAIGQTYNLTRERIRQIEKQALEKLRKKKRELSLLSR